MDDGAVLALFDELASLPPIGEWVRDAACRGMGDTFTTQPKSNASLDLIKATCLACPVLRDCDVFSSTNYVDGVWAGRWLAPHGNVTDLLEPINRTRRASTVVCGTLGGYRRHRREGEPACEACKAANAAAARAHKAKDAA